MEDRISWCLAVGRYESALQLAEADRTTTQELWDTVVQVGPAGTLGCMYSLVLVLPVHGCADMCPGLSNNRVPVQVSLLPQPMCCLPRPLPLLPPLTLPGVPGLPDSSCWLVRCSSSAATPSQGGHTSMGALALHVCSGMGVTNRAAYNAACSLTPSVRHAAESKLAWRLLQLQNNIAVFRAGGMTTDK